MKKLSRRKLMKGILAAPLMTAACRFAWGAGTNMLLAPPPVMTKFNVIIHGLAAIVITNNRPNDGVQVFLPDDGFGHKHLVGSYYIDDSPNTFPIDDDKAYALKLLNPSRTFPIGDIDRTQNAIISSSTVDTSALSQWRSVVLPYPGSIRTFRYRSRKDSLPLFSGNDVDLLGPQPKALAAIHVFTYDVTSGATPILKDSSNITIWSSIPDPNDGGVGNCHLYNEPSGTVDFCHSLRAFRFFKTINRKSSNIYLHLDFNIVDEKDGMTEVVGGNSVQGISPARGDLKDLAQRPSGAQGANCVKLLITP